MQFILDNALAGLIMGTLLLLAATVQLRGQQASIEASVHDMTKARAQSLVEVLKKDLETMGVGSDPSAESGLQQFDCRASHDDGRTTLFEFSSLEDPKDPDSAPALVTYELHEATADDGAQRTVRVGPTEAPIYELKRFKDGAPSGGSGALLTYFNIQLMDGDGEFKGEFKDAPNNCSGGEQRAARVSFVAALPSVERTANDQAATSGLNASRYGVSVYLPGMAGF